MNKIISRGLWTVLVTGGFLALGAGVAHADDTTDGSNGTGSGSQALLGADLPINVGGNGISILGDSSSSGSSNTGSSSGSSPSVWTGGTNGLLSGSQGAADASAPVTAGGNAISVLGDSSSDGSSFAGASGSGESGSASTSGSDGTASGSQIAGDASAPITVGGNAISVVGDSSSSGSDVSSPNAGGGSDASTSGENGALGGTQLVTGADAPLTVGGNAISVIGDSTVDGGDDGDVGGETTTPPGVVSPAGLGAAALLAATGSDLMVLTLALAVLLLAAGIAIMTRSRTARR